MEHSMRPKKLGLCHELFCKTQPRFYIYYDVVFLKTVDLEMFLIPGFLFEWNLSKVLNLIHFNIVN